MKTTLGGIRYTEVKGIKSRLPFFFFFTQQESFLF